ncbi:MurR/RpiR family transcriptional regulator [Lichenibacterium dinghuense]|uniref:MurR/RpiR family transcriptional regulator n=1 Tax=Lichenibacterium dinghuense TaxID=2895977 RepID=UPI001F27CEEF|nr:MurR/RpiR family transcriptional regulator [Lichenibacterium sp. 6Y81]
MSNPPAPFTARIAGNMGALSRAERRVAHVLRDGREEILFASASALAKKAGTSDATVVRTVRALGYSTFDELRLAMASEMRAEPSQADRLAATLDDVVRDPTSILGRTVAQHVRALTKMTHDVPAADFRSVVDLVVEAKRVVTFGIGPTSAVADYLVTQLSRFGFDAWSCTRTGILCADDLNRLRPGDALVVFAYGTGYAELVALLREAERLGLRRALVTDDLDPRLREPFDPVLLVARGRADMLSMHTATLGFVEALLVGAAARRPDESLENLRRLGRLRADIAGGTSTDLAPGAHVGPPTDEDRSGSMR